MVSNLEHARTFAAICYTANDIKIRENLVKKQKLIANTYKTLMECVIPHYTSKDTCKWSCTCRRKYPMGFTCDRPCPSEQDIESVFNLPPEVIANIIQFLKHEDIISCMQTCKYLYNVVSFNSNVNSKLTVLKGLYSKSSFRFDLEKAEHKEKVEQLQVSVSHISNIK